VSDKAPLRSSAGMVIGDVPLDPSLFDAQINVPVMHQVVVAQMAAWRRGTHKAKTRGEVSGGGRKPYRQKGTGRARQGSTRAPHWKGGGVVFGPTPERNYRKKVNKKMRVLALRSALTDRARGGKVAVIEDLSFETPKTKDAVGLLDEIGLGEGKVLVVTDGRHDTVERSFRNLQRVHVLSVDQINVYDILARDWVLFTKDAIEKLQQRSAQSAPTNAKEPAAATTGGESA